MKLNTRNVGDPDPHVFGLPGSGTVYPFVRSSDPDPTPSFFSKRCWADWNNTCKIKFWQKSLAKNLIFRNVDNVPLGELQEKKIEKSVFTSLKLLKKGLGSGVGSGSISQRYGSAPKCLLNTISKALNEFLCGCKWVPVCAETKTGDIYLWWIEVEAAGQFGLHEGQVPGTGDFSFQFAHPYTSQPGLV